jgi:hypothetical protein
LTSRSCRTPTRWQNPWMIQRLLPCSSTDTGSRSSASATSGSVAGTTPKTLLVRFICQSRAVSLERFVALRASLALRDHTQRHDQHLALRRQTSHRERVLFTDRRPVPVRSRISPGGWRHSRRHK